MSAHETFQTPTPTCPFCGYAMTSDDMVEADLDLFALAPDEGCETLTCPSCDLEFWVRGGYVPHYTSAPSEEHL